MLEPNAGLAPILTAGYGNRTLEEFISLLRGWRVEYLIDIRSSPYSRFKPEFNQDPFRIQLRQAGIRYVYMGDSLGGRPEDSAVYVDGKVDYGAVEELQSYQAGIERVRTASSKGLRILLMCSEGKPEMCHRSKLIGRTLVKLGVPVTHIDENGEPQDQTTVLLRLTGGSVPLFEQGLTWTSRRAYQQDDSEGK